jgi:hypothetical protein
LENIDIMKKIALKIFKIFLGILLVLVLAMFTVPLVFKDRIKSAIEQSINESVKAKVRIGDYNLGFFRNFPDMALSLDDFSITGIDEFENDTLVKCKSVSLIINLGSLFKKSGYEIKSIIINEAYVRTIVLKDGRANWDIMKESEPELEESEASSSFRILLQKVELRKSTVEYLDLDADMEAFIGNIDAYLTGDLTGSQTNLNISLNSDNLTYLMEGVKYIDSAKAEADINLSANLDSMKFYFEENHLLINDLRLNFAGTIAMPGDDIETDLTFSTGESSFKSLLSMVPSIYMTDFNDLKTSGMFTLEGAAKGIYSDSDSTMPDISLQVSVMNGLISYPSLPEKITNININSGIFIDGTELDRTTVNVSNFHLELAGNPFDMKFALRTPVSDPDFNAEIDGRVDLKALSNALPLDSLDLSGLINISMRMSGKMSLLEKEQYEKFQASGNMGIKDMLISMKGYPEIRIENAGFGFSPSFASMDDTRMKIGTTSDFEMSGKIENYIQYVLRGDVIRGKLSLNSSVIDLDDIMSALESDSTETDTTSLSIIKIPENIDFTFNAMVGQFRYDNIDVKNVRGTVTVRDGVLGLSEAGMDFLGGRIAMNADYNTRNILKPEMKADFSMENIGIKDAFSSFNTIQKLAPAAKGLNGRFGLQLSYSSLLGNDFMPVITTISGGGKIVSNEVTLVESAVYTRMKEILKLGDNYSNTFKDLNISFKIKDGRVMVSPFNTRVGNIKMNVGGDQGIDQTINYVIKTEIPRAELGSSVNSLINSLSEQASSFGLAFKPSDILKVNVKISGTVFKPVVAPFFGKESSDGTGIKTVVTEKINNAVEEQKEQAVEKVKNEAVLQADKLVQEAEEKGRILREEAARAAEKIRQEADVQSQKLIKEAEPKGTMARLAAQKAADTVKKEADKKADQIVREADARSLKLVEEAKAKREELINKL